jgi:molybdate transport system substrate-binding protein
VTVAAAASLHGVMTRLVAGHEARGEGPVTLVFGASGQLAQQITNGAPYDVFLSANRAWVERLMRGDHVRPGTVTPFAAGRLVLLLATHAELENAPALADGAVLARLRGDAFRHIALANPAHAPYGVAARQALQRAGLWEALGDKLVYGENVRQAQQFVESGNADAGLVALSLLGQPHGVWREVDHRLYAPVEHTYAIARDAPHPAAAAAFTRMLATPAAARILESGGLRPLPGGS